jgi:hypothetical protein
MKILAEFGGSPSPSGRGWGGAKTGGLNSVFAINIVKKLFDRKCV